jgi:lysophospholipase L1-like esterase
MNRTRIALAGLVAAAALAAMPRRETVIDIHASTRRFVIQTTLARVDDPIVILGDSIVEASTLPRRLCGHPVVNAGIGGASTTSGLGAMLSYALSGKRAAMIVVSLGLNDAAVPNSVGTFRSNYRAMLTELAALAPRRAVAAISLPETELEQSEKTSAAVVESYNAVLPELAREADVAFIALSAMPQQHTVDGIHLNAAGYEVWESAILRGVESGLCKIS